MIQKYDKSVIMSLNSFGMLTVEEWSETKLFKLLSNHVFHSL